MMKPVFRYLAGATASLLLLLGSGSALAGPARAGGFSYIQPDGSVVRLERHGDEFFNWTTLSGTDQVVELAGDGFWRPATLDPTLRKAAGERRAAANRLRSSLRGTHNDNAMTHGTRHIPVLLVAFSDVGFTISNPVEQFTNLLNQHGYSEHGGTGSVQDYYFDNSHGAFTPVFDVYGPVTLPHTMKYYGERVSANQSDRQAELALYDAATLLDGVIDFSKYDYDYNSVVDMVLFYYAGYNEAEGGSTDSIWPHQWNLMYSSNPTVRNASFDGKRIGAYFCTSELKGNSGHSMCGIGTTCHEFGHSLGLPDFYDTDYEENGSAGALYSFSVMCGGCYNNEGRTPPYYNAEERIILGWMSTSDVPELQEGSYTFGSVKDDISYTSQMFRDGEYFLFECRDGSGWDAPLPAGLAVYHVDKSSRIAGGGYTAADLWEYRGYLNSINAYGSHPCFYMVPAEAQSSLDYHGSVSAMVFPGSRNVTGYVPLDWDGDNIGLGLSNISYKNGNVSFTVYFSQERSVIGTVKGVDGKPVAGVRVVLSAPSSASAGVPRMLRAPEKRLQEVLSDESGAFSLSLEGFEGDTAHLTFSKEGYQTLGLDVKMEKRIMSVSVMMLKVGESPEVTYGYFDPSGSSYMFGDGESDSLMASVLIGADELPAQGGLLTSVSIVPYWNAKAYYIIVDAGEERLLTYEIPAGTLSYYATGLETVDLRDRQVSIPAGKDIYVGYAVEEADYAGYNDYRGYLFTIATGSGNLYLSAFSKERSNWVSSTYTNYALVLEATIAGTGSEDPPQEAATLAEMGITSIADPGHGRYAAGDAFSLNLVPGKGKTLSGSILWTLDGEKITDGAKSVSLPAGEHLLTASYSLSDGTSETLELLLVAE